MSVTHPGGGLSGSRAGPLVDWAWLVFGTGRFPFPTANISENSCYGNMERSVEETHKHQELIKPSVFGLQD